MIWREKQQAEIRFQQVRQLAHSIVFELDDAIEDPANYRAGAADRTVVLINLNGLVKIGTILVSASELAQSIHEDSCSG